MIFKARGQWEGSVRGPSVKLGLIHGSSQVFSLGCAMSGYLQNCLLTLSVLYGLPGGCL